MVVSPLQLIEINGGQMQAEPLDLDALGPKIDGGDLSAVRAIASRLIAELRACRAERDDANHEVMLERARAERTEARCNDLEGYWRVATARAVRAEADCATMRDLATGADERATAAEMAQEHAEARITAALDLCDRYRGDTERVRRALTGGDDA
jgi:hypothetical protein